MDRAAERRRDRANRLLPVFAGASLLAVGAGCFVASEAGIGAGSWARNLIAWALSAAAAFAIGRSRPAGWLPMAIAALAALGLAATFVNAGQEGVHRWWDIGPLHVNAAALLLPATVVALACFRGSALLASGMAAGLTILLALQPDASQASAFGTAMAVAIGLRGGEAKARWAAASLLLAIAGLSWLRPDPLAPVPEVEEIVALAWQVAPPAAVLGVLGLIAAALSPLVLRRSGAGPAAAGLSIYMAVMMLAPAAGAFPVPLMGIGMSPVVGLWLGVGLLAVIARCEGLRT